jgi:nucleotide-binding universal stress UspA family protein
MKNVLLLVHDDAGQEARLQCALDLTRAIGGHLACVDVAIMPRFMNDYISSGGEGVLIAQEEAREARNRYRLEQRLTAEDVPWHWVDEEGAIADSLRDALRLNDIVVVNAHIDGFPGRELAHLAGDLIVKSRKPILAVPPAARRLQIGGRAMIAWDGSPSAEVALRAALPLLALAENVMLLEVDDGSIQLSAQEAAEYLSRHGIKPSVRREAALADVASTVILAEIRKQRIDWLVMGGFGHHRLTERLFGGVTRRLFRDADVPLFLAH